MRRRSTSRKLCLEIFLDPEVLSCGHSVCQRCLHLDSSTPACSICHWVTEQKPVANLVLRTTCEAYLREKERESNGGVKCFQHGEKINFFCQTDKETICSECRKQTHSSHIVQPLTQAVHQCKGQVKKALRPAEKALQSLQNGTNPHAKAITHIQSQAQRTKRLIKEEFAKFQQFLKQEEEARINALKDEEEQKTDKLEEWIEREMISLSSTVTAVQEDMGNDSVTFLKNYDGVLQRAKYTVLDPEVHPGALIDVSKHLGNLRFRVWEKMRDICPHYPVVLDPNTAPADFSIADDLVCVRKTAHDRPIPVPHRRNRLVLGSDGYVDGHVWDVEVGDSNYWILGVCRRSSATGLLQPLTPGNGFWGLSHDGHSYKLLGSSISLDLNIKPKVVQLQLLSGYGSFERAVKFVNVSTGFTIASSPVPEGTELVPFLIPGSVLRILPDQKIVPGKMQPRTIDLPLILTMCIIGLYLAIIWAQYIPLRSS
ncbi:tripartite motif containing 35-1 isoform X2 [Brachyhypopomus gauderio]|uniref:tripartite motif containing 35-1 isoform X2 n=1 Tax=Brachyhypopomus gauderio TaxID=698409 RepID=UPI0040417D6B